MSNNTSPISTYVPKKGERVRIVEIMASAAHAGAAPQHKVGDVGVCCQDAVSDVTDKYFLGYVAIYIEPTPMLDNGRRSGHVWCRCELVPPGQPPALKKGDRVRGYSARNNSPYEGTVHYVEPDTGNVVIAPSMCLLRAATVELLTPSPSAAGRLHESGCVLCGYAGPSLTALTCGPHGLCGFMFCDACGRGKSGHEFDAEITRRLALKSAPVDETRELKVGDGWMTEIAADWQPKVGELCEGLACSNGEPLSGAFASFTSGGNATLSSGRIISRESLRPVKDAPARAGSVDAAKPAGVTPSGGAAYNSTQLVVAGRVDPYASEFVQRLPPGKTRYDFGVWLASQTGIATGLTKYEQAKAQLNRPLRTGPLKDRDKWGQRLALKGWETEDD